MVTESEANVASPLFSPWAGGVGGVRMGLTRIPADDWLQQPADMATRLAHKRALYRQQPQSVIQQLPVAAEVARELLELLQTRVPTHAPRQSARSELQSAADTFAHLPDIAQAGLLVAEDLCVMQTGDNGDYQLVAASLTAPSYWRLADKIGKNLKDIHTPVVMLQDRIGSQMSTFFERLEADTLFMRGNWHVHSSPDWYAEPGQQEDYSNIQRCFVRTERQTLRRLPRSRAIIFTILVTVTSIGDLSALQLAELAMAYQHLHPADAAARHREMVEPPLRALIAAGS